MKLRGAPHSGPKAPEDPALLQREFERRVYFERRNHEKQVQKACAVSRSACSVRGSARFRPNRLCPVAGLRRSCALRRGLALDPDAEYGSGSYGSRVEERVAEAQSALS